MTMRLLRERIDAALAVHDIDPFAASFLHHRARLRVLSMIEHCNHMVPRYLPGAIDDEYIWERLQQGYEQGIADARADDNPDEWQLAAFLDLRGRAHIWLSQNRAVVAKVDEITDMACRDITLMVVGTDKLGRTCDPGMPLALGIVAYKKPGFAKAFTDALHRAAVSRHGLPSDDVRDDYPDSSTPNTETDGTEH